MAMATKLDKVFTYRKGFPSVKSHDSLIMDLIRLRDKLITLYIPFHKMYGYYTWQSARFRYGIQKENK